MAFSINQFIAVSPAQVCCSRYCETALQVDFRHWLPSTSAAGWKTDVRMCSHLDWNSVASLQTDFTSLSSSPCSFPVSPIRNHAPVLSGTLCPYALRKQLSPRQPRQSSRSTPHTAQVHMPATSAIPCCCGWCWCCLSQSFICVLICRGACFNWTLEFQVVCITVNEMILLLQ